MQPYLTGAIDAFHLQKVGVALPARGACVTVLMAASVTLCTGFIGSSAVAKGNSEFRSPPASAPQTEPRPEIVRELPEAARVGGIKFSFWGFDVYRASLWASSSFKASSYAAHPFALELAYLRSLDGLAIAKRSIEEMQRQTTMKVEQGEAWLAAMARIFPNVKAGDRIVGVNRPGLGAAFWVNGAQVGEIADAEFARLFFGVWLSSATSEPAMRKALLEKAQP